jgi:cytochrome c553
MMEMRQITQLIMMVVLGFGVLLATAAGKPVASIADNGALQSLKCVACHGAEGRGGDPGIPNLVGQDGLYLARELALFRSGERRSPRMEPIAQSLSDGEIGALAAYFSSLPPTPVAPSHD